MSEQTHDTACIQYQSKSQMPVPNSPANASALQISRQFLRELFASFRRRDFGVRFWDGSRLAAEAGAPERFTLVLRHPGALRHCFLPPKAIKFCEAYFFGAIDVEGDLKAFWHFLQVLYQGGLPAGALGRKRIELALGELPHEEISVEGRRAVRLEGEIHGQQRDQQAITSHFDVSNEFYALWLDSRMLYTCAYFKSDGNDLETAQKDKLDYICRKLRLKSGERLLDIGCGWGGLALHAAEHYGVEVLAVTLSEAQARWGQERLARAGLAGRCRIEHSDYRDIREPAGFDKISSIGLMEHIGAAKLNDYFRHVHGLLRPGGVFLNHAIGVHPQVTVPAGATFINLYVFPDGELEPIHAVLGAAEHAGFEVRDVENLREHYRLTCHHWLRRLEDNAEPAIALTEEVTYRMWRLYLAFSEFGFSTGLTNIYQSLLSKPDQGRSNLPLERADWYAAID